MLHLYRNQSFDLDCKLMNWFLHKCDIGLRWVNKKDRLVAQENILKSNVNEHQKQHRRCSVKKGVPKNFANFTRKHLCRSLF